MAENRESVSSLDFGIEATDMSGNLQAAEAFLSGDDSAITSSPDEITVITKEDVKKPASKTDPKVKVAPAVAKKEEKEEEEPFDALAELDKSDEEEEQEEQKEDIKDKKPKKEDKDPEEIETEPEIEFNEFEALSKDLFKIGIFTPVEGEEDLEKVKIDTPELLKARFEKEGQVKATQWLDGVLSRFGDDRRDLFEAIYIDGVDPKEYIPVYNELQNLKGADITQESVQERVYREYYKRIGWNAETIDKKLQKTKDYGDLEDETKELHQQLIAQDEQMLADKSEEKAQAQALQQRIDQEYKVSIAKILEEKVKNRDFDGIPLNDKKKTQAFDFLNTKKYKTADGQLLTEFDKFIIDTRRPENHALRVKIALLALDNFDLTKVEKRAVSKESSAIFNELAQKKQKKTNGAATQPAKSQVSSWFT